MLGWMMGVAFVHITDFLLVRFVCEGSALFTGVFHCL